MGRKTIELDEYYDAKLKRIAQTENRKKVEEIRHLINSKFHFLGLQDTDNQNHNKKSGCEKQ